MRNERPEGTFRPLYWFSCNGTLPCCRMVVGIKESQTKGVSTAPLDGLMNYETTSVTKVLAWEQPRNTRGANLDWRFTTDDERIKLKKLYPS